MVGMKMADDTAVYGISLLLSLEKNFMILLISGIAMKGKIHSFYKY